MIESARFLNVRALHTVEVELGRLTVLMGPTASGKTTVLEGLGLLSRLASGDPRDVFTGDSEPGLLASRGARGALALQLGGHFHHKPASLAVTFPAVEEYPFDDTYVLAARFGEHAVAHRQPLGLPSVAGVERPLAGQLPPVRPYALDARALAAPWPGIAWGAPRLEPDGAGLAAVLADLASARPDDFIRLQDALRALVPSLNRIRLVPARAFEPGSVARSEEERRAPWHELAFDLAGARDVPARVVGRGTLLALGLLTLLAGPSLPDLLLLDDLETGLSPRALSNLVAQLRMALALHPRLQIVATTHSPLLLDHLDAAEVRVMTVRPGGAAACASLAAHPDCDQLRRTMRSGEVWRTVGDGWVDRALAKEPTDSPATG